MRPQRRARRRTDLAQLERLEARDLPAASALGFSLPALSISGSAGTRAAWGGTLGISATVANTGTSTITNPIAQAPGDSSTADAAATTIAVLITPRPHSGREIQIGTFEAPAVGQNSLVQVTDSLTLPSRPAGFAGGGGKFYVHLLVNSTGAIQESSGSRNLSAPIAVKVASRALPELRVTDFETPSTLAPGDTIAPTITIANDGTADSGEPIEVALVASTTPSFTVGSSIVALYDVTVDLPAASDVPSGGILAAFNQDTSPADNAFTFTAPAVTLPTSPSTYYLGVVVDPYGQINQLSLPSNVLEQIHVVGPSVSGLPGAGVVSTANTNPFPEPASGTVIGITSTTTGSGSSQIL